MCAQTGRCQIEHVRRLFQSYKESPLSVYVCLENLLVALFLFWSTTSLAKNSHLTRDPAAHTPSFKYSSTSSHSTRSQYRCMCSLQYRHLSRCSKAECFQATLEELASSLCLKDGRMLWSSSSNHAYHHTRWSCPSQLREYG
jgi:hypothetical protein